MNIPQSYEYNFELEISKDEYEVIKKFLAYYRNEIVLVADSYRQDFSIVPLGDNRIIFKTNEDTWKSINFCKRIFHNGKPYVVELDLQRDRHMEDENLSIHEFRIITNKKVHFITLDTKDDLKRNILFNIISIFDEKKIISPEQAYAKQMYTNKALQGFIVNHEWQNIDIGIKQMPELANALFIIREGFENFTNYSADFGTILYQLVSYRMNNLSTFYEEDLRELDKLILKLRKTELLKVQLYEQVGGLKSWPTGSILLESNNSNGRVHISRKYTVYNTELADEHKELKSLKLNRK